MMEKLGAPQTHLGLKAMIKVNNEQKSICFLFLLWSHTSFRDQVHLSIFCPTKFWLCSFLFFGSFLCFEQQNIFFKMLENKRDNSPNIFHGKDKRLI